jgi:hypothetical protein
VLIKWRTVRSLTRTVRHRSPKRLRHRCVCTDKNDAASKNSIELAAEVKEPVLGLYGADDALGSKNTMF